MSREGWQYIRGKQVEDRQILCSEHSIEAFETKRAFSIQEVGDMGLLKFRGSCQGRAGQEAAIDAPQDFQSKVLMKSLEFHVCTITLRYIKDKVISVRNAILPPIYFGFSPYWEENISQSQVILDIVFD
jgi:hypothetical protein